MPIERPNASQTQIPLSTQIQVLGNILKPSQTFSQVVQAQPSKQAPSSYIAKIHLMKVRILKAHHLNKSSSLDLSKKFPKGKYFLQNDSLKTRRFYEFILVDLDFVEVSHIQNRDSTKICYSKCKIFKVIFELE